MKENKSRKRPFHCKRSLLKKEIEHQSAQRDYLQPLLNREWCLQCLSPTEICQTPKFHLVQAHKRSQVEKSRVEKEQEDIVFLKDKRKRGKTQKLQKRLLLSPKAIVTQCTDCTHENRQTPWSQKGKKIILMKIHHVLCLGKYQKFTG